MSLWAPTIDADADEQEVNVIKVRRTSMSLDHATNLNSDASVSDDAKVWRCKSNPG